MYVPKKLGGLELSFPEILRIEEALAWIDGSTSWVVTLCSGAAWFVGFLDPVLAGQLFKTDKVCLAGSGATTGVANKMGDAYEISGFWKYATGSLLASAFTVNCHVKESGVPLQNPDGSPVVRPFVLLKDEVVIHDTWNSMGMIATGSHSMEVKKAVVPFNRSFLIHPSQTTLADPIFQYPFLQLAETTLAVNLSGMAIRFLDLCNLIYSKKDNNLKKRLTDQRDALDEIRRKFYTETDAAWAELITKSRISDKLLISLSNLSHELVISARVAVNELYPHCGLHAADMETEINRVWRNFHTAGQHSMFAGRRSYIPN
jgi:hypothetical protein